MARLLVLLLILTCYPALAESPDGAWFRGLKQNTTGASCCDISDCKLTTAEWFADQWWAEVQGTPVPVPKDKVLKNKQSPDGEAYICSGYGGKIYCFVPPNMGY